MDKKEWQAMSIDEQVRELNQRLASGESLTTFTKRLGVDKGNLSRKLKREGYSLVEGQYIVVQGIEGQLDILGAALEAKAEPKAEAKAKPIKKAAQSDKAPTAPRGTAGRPGREYAVKKLTIEIHADIFKALHHYKIDEGIKINEFIENLLKEALPAEYLKDLKR